jgi:hypothetical protein
VRILPFRPRLLYPTQLAPAALSVKITHLRAAILAVLHLLAPPLHSQQANPPFHPLPPPPTGAQSETQLGFSTAMDGNFTIVGAPRDDVGAANSGVVKIFHSFTGALLRVISSPIPELEQNFGWSVAVSGSRVVIGAPSIGSGAPHAGRVFVYDLAANDPAVPVVVIENPSPQFEDQFGASVAISGTRIVVADPARDTPLSDNGIVYVYELTSSNPGAPIVTLNNPTPSTMDYFGRAVAISGSYIVAGAHLDDTGAGNAGSAYVYDLTSSTPTTPVVTLNNPSPAGGDSFGNAVAISGTKVVVGVPQDDTGATDAGCAYVFDLSGDNPATPIVVLNNPDPVSSPFGGDKFGYSIAISGSRVVVGAYHKDVGGLAGIDAGVAYAFDLDNAAPGSPVATLVNPSPAPNDNFGQAVAVSGTRTVVGCPSDDTRALNAGGAYLFNLGSTTPSFHYATLDTPSPEVLDRFGTSIAISESHVIVGSMANVAYVYNLASASPYVPAITLNNPNPGSAGAFGYALAASGSRVAVGDYLDSTTATNAGRVFIYDVASSTPAVPIAILKNPTPTSSEFFGFSVAIHGTLVIVGAIGSDEGADNAGKAYVFDLAQSSPTIPLLALNNPTPASADAYGFSVGISGKRAVVGTPYDDTRARYAGSVYTYDLNGATPGVPVATLHNPALGSGGLFGQSVAISGNSAVVGAHQHNSAAGIAYVYDLASNSTTVPVTTLNNPASSFTDYFGYAVAISGSRVVVGAYQEEGGSTDSGKAYVFDLNGDNPGVPTIFLSHPASATGDYFGAAVAINGTNVAIGTPNKDTVARDKGYAYVFDLNTPPVVTLIGANPLTIEARNIGYRDAGATATDAEDGALIPVNPFDAVDLSKPGTYTVTWTVKDSGGLSGSATRTVNIVDTTPPQIFVPKDIVVEALSLNPQMVQFKSATAADVAGVTSLTSTHYNGMEFPIGTTTVTVTAKDAAGNISTATFKVVVRDSPPIITTPQLSVAAKATSVAGAVVSFPSISATDIIGVVDITYSKSSGTLFPIGTTAVTVTARDGSGNTDTGTINVTVLPGDFDKGPPVLSIKTPSGGRVPDTFSFSGFVKDDTSLGSLNVLFNGTPVLLDAPMEFIRNKEVPWSVSGLRPKNGRNTLEVYATDGANQRSESLRKTVYYINYRPALAGVYNILLHSTGAPDTNTTGRLKVTLNASGLFTARLFCSGATMPFSGILNNQGDAELWRRSSLIAGLNFSVTEPEGITAGISSSWSGPLISSGSGKVSNYSGRNPVPTAVLNLPARGTPTRGIYQVSFPSKPQAPALVLADYPQGHGYVALTISNRGTISAVGKLADGSTFSSGSNLRVDGTAAFFAQLYNKAGLARGELAFADLPDTDASGADWLWIRPADGRAHYYPAGWTEVRFDAVGTKYTRPTSLDFGQGPTDLINGNARLAFSGGLLDHSLNKAVSIDPLTGRAMKIPATDSSYSFSLNAGTGIFTGRFPHSENKRAHFTGILLNKGANRGGFGYFLSPVAPGNPETGQSGAVSLDASGP